MRQSRASVIIAIILDSLLTKSMYTYMQLQAIDDRFTRAIFPAFLFILRCLNVSKFDL